MVFKNVFFQSFVLSGYFTFIQVFLCSAFCMDLFYILILKMVVIYDCVFYVHPINLLLINDCTKTKLA